MQYKISKENVKEAIIHESLNNGSFFVTNRCLLKDNGTCSVCALGAVLRKTKPNFFTANDAEKVTENKYSIFDRNPLNLRENFLSNLSIEFEEYSYDVDPNSDDMRMFLLFLIEAECPETLTFEV